MALLGRRAPPRRNKARVNLVSYIVFTCVFGLGIVLIGLVNLENSRNDPVYIGYRDMPEHHHIQGNTDVSTVYIPTGDEIQLERKSRIREYCHNHILESNLSSMVPRKMLDFNNTIAYCRINKCASTFSLETLRNIFHCDNSCGDIEISVPTKSYGVDKTREYMKDKFSFFFVREPYRRLFSTYSNKFYLPKEYWAPIGPDTVRLYRANPSKVSLQYGHDITFEELLRYTVDRFENNQRLDVHLRPIYKHCNPCFFDFSYIGKLETLDSDWNKMFDIWKETKLVDVARNSSVREMYSKTNLPEVYHFYRSKKALKDSGISTYSLFLRTWVYYQITGRISKHMDLPYNEDEVENVEYVDFHRAVSDAIDKSKPYTKAIKTQREEALKQAYKTIPRDLLERVRRLVRQDCSMFGYDDRPDWLFGDELSNFKTDFDYFRGI